MSDGRPAANAAGRVASGTGRLIRAWRRLPHERRLAAYASLGLFVALFLPWYQETVIATGKSNLQAASATLTGWGAFSFVEAAVLAVAAGVLTLLFQRAEGRAFHLPGGDGGVITAAGFWTCILIVWRIFDKQGTDSHGQFATTSGIEWGIFVALGVAAFMTYAGSRIRAAHRPEPPLPGDPPLRDAATVPAGGEPAPYRRAATPERRVRPPRPVRARESSPLGELPALDDPPTLRISRKSPPPDSSEAPTRPGPSTPAAGAPRGLPPDEQLTIPLDEDSADA